MQLKRGKRLYLGYRALGVQPRLAAEYAGVSYSDARKVCERCGVHQTHSTTGLCRKCRQWAEDVKRRNKGLRPSDHRPTCPECGARKSPESKRCRRCAYVASRKDFTNHPAVALYRQPLTMREVGQQLGITQERVRQILKRAGEPSRKSGPRHNPMVRLNHREREQWRVNYRRQKRFYQRYRAGKAYRSGMSLTEVAVEILGTSCITTAAYVLRGIQKRPVGQYDRAKRAPRTSTAEVNRLLDGQERTMTARQATTTALRASYRGLHVTRRSLPGGMVALRCVDPREASD